MGRDLGCFGGNKRKAMLKLWDPYVKDVQLVCLTPLLWLHGIIPVGSIDLRHTFSIAIPPYLLWVRSRLDRIAGAALDAFRPVLAVSDAEFARLHYELTTLPARGTRLVTALAALFFFSAYGSFQAEFSNNPRLRAQRCSFNSGRSCFSPL